jgi:radical SAM superfamily enzyme YgiQ (UPF0313 family)
MDDTLKGRLALIEAGSPGLNIYSHVAMGRGVPLLATVARDAGYETRAYVEDISGKGSVDWDFVATADVVGFSTITCTLPRTRELLERAREVNPDAVVLFGGPEPTCDPRRSLELGVDYVVKGEGEHVLPPLLDALMVGDVDRVRELAGLVWLEDGRLCEAPPPVQLAREELDALPFIEWSLVEGSGNGSVAPVWRARGCPERCDFCEVCEIWPRYRRRDEGRSVEELAQAQGAGYSTAFLIDDNAAANKPAFLEFLRGVIARGYGGVLVTQMRADAVFNKDGSLDRELLRLLKKAAALTVVCVGVESCDDTSLERVSKHTDASKTARALKAMRRYGLMVHGMFIALNEDTKEVVKRNGDYARRYVNSLQYLFETPLPGTKRTLAHEQAGAMLFTDSDELDLYDGMHVVLRPERMTPYEMLRLVGDEYELFYSKARVVGAALTGTFLRFRRLGEGQRAFLRELSFGRRVTSWIRMHIAYKYAPVSFLAIGRKRVLDFLRDPAYARYMERLNSM